MGSKWSRRAKKVPVRPQIEQPVTAFDDLSNDLILEIFDYLPSDQIHLSFAGLNARASELIETYPHKIDLQSRVQQANSIRSLEITRPFHLPIFFSFQPDQFLSLRALRLSNLKPEDALRVLEYAPSEQLEYIYLGICPTYGDFNRQKLIRLIQKEILALGQYQLRHVSFKEKFALAIDDLPERLVALQSCEFTGCPSFSVLSRILDRMPNLISMKTSTLNITADPLLSNRGTLTRLSLRPHFTCSGDELADFIRQCCPHLKRLTIEVYLFRSAPPGLLINKHEWIRILPPGLTRFWWRTIDSPFVHPTKAGRTSVAAPAKQQLTWISTDGKERLCQVIIDAVLLHVWENH